MPLAVSAFLQATHNQAAEAAEVAERSQRKPRAGTSLHGGLVKVFARACRVRHSRASPELATVNPVRHRANRKRS